MIEIDKIYNEDCLLGMSRIPDGSVDCIITDLPYEVLNDGNPDARWDKMIPLEPMWDQFIRITKPNAAIVLFAQGMFTAQLMMSQPRMWRYNLVWDKVRTTGYLNAKKQPLRCHEDICVFYAMQPTYNPQKTKGQPNHSRGKLIGKQTNRCYGVVGKPVDVFTEDKFPRSIVVSANKVQGNEHPTQKPIPLLQWLIRTYSNEGDTILDATIGSGTTAIAAIKEKRHWIGFETNKEYFDIAQRRIADELRQPTLF